MSGPIVLDAPNDTLASQPEKTAIGSHKVSRHPFEMIAYF
jgi:hypothetical protein